jgi:AraC family transcriptional regulator, regulatory protein of adaptative response / methylated-DNA-[protein]-cysteine methyltransferase
VRNDPPGELVENVCQYIEQNLEGPLTLEALGVRFERSPVQLQRTFKKVLGITPREYADTCRLNRLKTRLRSGESVTHAMYQAGYGSSSRLYEKAAAQLGMTPASYRRGAGGVRIGYTVTVSPIGQMLVAATDKGVCCIRFGDTAKKLADGLREEYRDADLRRDEETLRPWVDELLRHLRGEQQEIHLPLDIRATAFQRRVWEYLQSMLYGSTASYSEIARALGQPTAARAVARACATNPVAVAIPCHRVVREDGNLGGYRWGLDRKKALLEMERKTSSEV